MGNEMSAQQNKFRDACYDTNTAQELREALTLPEADATDLREWDITPDEWRDAIKDALSEREAEGGMHAATLGYHGNEADLLAGGHVENGVWKPAKKERTTKIESVVVLEDTRVHGHGVVEAGTYRVEMPADYETALVTAYDIIQDESMRVIDEMPEKDGTTEMQRIAQIQALLAYCIAGAREQGWTGAVTDYEFTAEDLAWIADQIGELEQEDLAEARRWIRIDAA